MTSEMQRQLLESMLDPVTRCLSPESARQLVGLRADEQVQHRVDELADKSTFGALTELEKAEYEAYISAANVLGVLQAKARKLISTSSAA